MEKSVEDFADLSEVVRPGVYVLLFRGTVVYVGQSKCMLQRIYYHRSKDRATPSWVPVKKGIVFDEVRVKVVHEPDARDLLERELIARYRPKHNTLHKPEAPVRGPVSIRVRGVDLSLTVRERVERRI